MALQETLKKLADAGYSVTRMRIRVAGPAGGFICNVALRNGRMRLRVSGVGTTPEEAQDNALRTVKV